MLVNLLQETGYRQFLSIYKQLLALKGKKLCCFVSCLTPNESAHVSAEGAIFFQSDLRPADDHTPTLTSIIVGDLATTKASEFPSLPGFTSTSDGAFTWRSMDLQSFPEALISAYQETVNWESNSF